MKILIIGSGGREHALAWKVRQSESVEKVFVAPGNAGTALENQIENIDIQVTDINALILFAKKENISLTIVGPEAPLAAGMVDEFQREGLAIFGPSQNAAQLESSKSFCKDFLIEQNIPTAKYACFSDFNEAKNYIEKHPLPLVIKADGLAAGKGVVIAHSHEEAINTAESMRKRVNELLSKNF